MDGKRRSSAHDDQGLATLLGPAPCDECLQAPRCKARLLACERFWLYARLLRWEEAPREPTHRIWRGIFRPNQRTPEQIARMRERDRQTKAARGTRGGRRPNESLEAA